MNRLLDQEVEEVAMEEFDEAMRVAQVTATIVIPSSSGVRMSPSPPPPSPSGSAQRGEPSKPTNDLPDGAGPGETRMFSHTPSLGDSEDLQSMVDREPNNFLWTDEVEDPKWVGLQIQWQMMERKYLARIRKLEEITAQVKRALDQVPPQLSKRRHQDQDVGHDEGHDVGQVVDQDVGRDEDQDEEVVVYDVPDDDGEDGDLQSHHGQHGHHGSETQRVRATGSSNSSRRENSQGATQHLGSGRSDRSGVKQGPPVKKSKAGKRGNLSIQSNSSSASASYRSHPDLVSIFHVFGKNEAADYIKGVTTLMQKVKDLISVNNVDILTHLTTGSNVAKFQVFQHVARHLNVLRSEEELLRFMSRKNLVDLPVRYASAQTFPAMPNVAPTTKANTLSVYNACWTNQGGYQRNRFLKLVLSLTHPKLASCVMSLQGDQQYMALLKNLFSKESHPWLQAFHYTVMMTVTSVYDLSRNRVFFPNIGYEEVFLPSNVSSVQFENLVYKTRSISWTREQFETYFRSEKVATPLRDLDNLHLKELQIVKATLNRSYH